MVTIRDMIYVNQLERELGRRLSERELEQDELELRFPNGSIRYVQIPRLRFPDDLLPPYALFSQEHEPHVESEAV